jgi:hypothetical protein
MDQPDTTVVVTNGPPRTPLDDFERVLTLHVRDVEHQHQRGTISHYKKGLARAAAQRAKSVEPVDGFARLNSVLLHADTYVAKLVARTMTVAIAGTTDFYALIKTDLPGELSPLLFNELFTQVIDDTRRGSFARWSPRARRQQYLQERVEANEQGLSRDDRDLARVLSCDWEGTLSTLVATAATLARADQHQVLI